MQVYGCVVSGKWKCSLFTGISKFPYYFGKERGCVLYSEFYGRFDALVEWW